MGVKHIKGIALCIIVGIAEMIGVLVIAFLIMLFSTSSGRSTTFFNSLFFEANDMPNGVTNLAFGLTGIFEPILITTFLISFFNIIVYGAYRFLEEKKRQLVKKREQEEKDI